MFLVTFLQLLVYSFLFLVWVATMYTFWLTLFHPPFVPTINKKVLEHLEHCLAANSDITFFCEPGCGFAGVSIHIAKKFPDLKVIAIEYNFAIYLLAKARAKLIKSRVEIVWGDFLSYDLNSKINGQNTLIYCYLLPDLMNLAYQKGKFENTQVVTLDFKISVTDTQNIIEITEQGFQKKIYQYNFRR